MKMENWISQAKARFLNARRLSKQLSEHESEPYKEKYKAKEILETLLTESSKYKENQVNCDLLNSLFHHEIGVICLDTEEPAAGEEHLTTALTFIEKYHGIAKYSVILMNIYNQLGILWCVRKDFQRALEYLKRSELLYNEVVKDSKSVVSEMQLFSLDENEHLQEPAGEYELNKSFAHTLYYLAQVYGNMEAAEQAAMYCYKTLKWQIDHKLCFDPLEWSLNAAILSQYFASKEQFHSARHLLACASFNLSKSTEKEDTNDDRYQHTRADIYRCWGKYGLSLLTTSKNKQNNQPDNSSLSEIPSHEENQYTLLDCNLSEWESQVTNKYVHHYDEARSVFLHAQKCFNDAKLYYTLNDFASDYVAIIQNTSELYSTLAFFEPSYERACKMFKRRADLLEETLNTLNVKYYLNTCRQLRFELADIYSEMMDMKLTLREKHKAADQKSIQKINVLIQRSIHHFLQFVETLKENKALPNRFTEDLVRPGLLAHFYIARLHSKLISNKPDVQLLNLRLSDDYYNFVAEYVKRNPDHEHYIKEELDVITEMLKLLPQRIQMLTMN